MAGLQRTTFHTSRAAEYFYARELEAQTGQPKNRFRAVALKELVDNALDSAEVASRAPEVVVEATLDADDGGYELTVSDNGGGIEPHVVERTLDFNTRTSDKALYRTPTRGQQGNALKTVVAMPFALGEDDPEVIVQARGVRHRIRAVLGAGDFPDIQANPSRVETGAGTLVKVRLPGKSNPYGVQTYDLGNARRMIRGYHLFNPHAKVSFCSSVLGINHAESANSKQAETHHPTNPNYDKFDAESLLVVHWFGEGDFVRLVKHLVGHGKGETAIGAFLKDFRGFSARAKAAAAREGLPVECRTLADLTDEDIVVLYHAMCDVVKEPSHNVLGPAIGEAHLVGALRRFHEECDLRPGRAWHKVVKTSLNGAPAVIGVAVTDLLKERRLGFIAVTITGLGQKVNRHGTKEYSVPKQDLVSALEVPFHKETLKVPEGLQLWDVLRKELLNFRRKQNTVTAHISYEHWRESDHDDLVLAAALACWKATYQRKGTTKLRVIR